MYVLLFTFRRGSWVKDDSNTVNNLFEKLFYCFEVVNCFRRFKFILEFLNLLLESNGLLLILSSQGSNFFFIKFFNSHKSILLFLNFYQLLLKQLNLLIEDFIFLNDKFGIELHFFVMIVSIRLLFI